MPQIQLELPVLLPDILHEKDQCVDRLMDRLKQERGIDELHIEEADPAKLHIRYDPDRISLEKVKRIARQSGAGLTHRFHHLLLEVSGIRHPRHARQIERTLLGFDGIKEAATSAAGILRLEWDREVTDQERVLSAIEAQGLSIREQSSVAPAPNPEHQEEEEHDHDHDHQHEHDHGHAHGHGHDHQGIFGEYTELYFAIGSGIFWLSGLLASFSAGSPPWLSITLFIIAIILGGYFTLLEAIAAIRNGDFEIDFLMLVAAAGAASLGKWQEAALLLFLFSLGHALENYAMNRARKSIKALSDLAPPTALLKEGAAMTEVNIDQLSIGDTIIIKPNSKIAADGVIIQGRSAVDQSPITGESIPVEKYAHPDPDQVQNLAGLPSENRAFAGTINGGSVLEVKVLKLAKDSTLSRLVTMVKEAETQKSPTQQLTDKFERYFVPAVLVLVFLLLFAFLIIDEPFSASFYRAMAVLVAASPCALAISTPSAVLAGVARAARQGVLIKGGRPLEDLGELQAVAFDKTGTLTEGQPRLTEVIPLPDTDKQTLLRVAVAVEQLSDHPLATAIVAGGKEMLADADLPKAQDLEALTARGIRAQLENSTVHIGNRRLFRELTGQEIPGEIDRIMTRLETEGNTAMIVHREGTYLGVIGVRDVARAEAAATLQALKKLDIRRMIMLTGDHQKVADSIAGELGITDPMGSLLPEDKVAALEKLKAEEGKVAMVGDGVNDAPAMAKSTVGIAMGAAGSDVALETADIALMADKLDNLPFAIGLSRKAKNIIRQNLWISLGMVAILVPLTILGFAEIGPAVIAHEGSTLVVVANALRLLAYRQP